MRNGFYCRSAFFAEIAQQNKMKNYFNTKTLCRAGVIAALYVALTYAFAPVAFLPTLEIRPAEALTILPLFFPEAVPALWIGCMLANLASPTLVYDVTLGAAATLIASLGTYAVGRLIKDDVLRLSVGGLFPVFVNAFLIPVIFIFIQPEAPIEAPMTEYWISFGSMCATEALWVYALGGPLYFSIKKLRDKGVRVFTSPCNKEKEVKELNEKVD